MLICDFRIKYQSIVLLHTTEMYCMNFEMDVHYIRFMISITDNRETTEDVRCP